MINFTKEFKTPAISTFKSRRAKKVEQARNKIVNEEYYDPIPDCVHAFLEKEITPYEQWLCREWGWSHGFDD